MICYLINGYSRVGKDTFINEIIKASSGKSSLVWSIADPARNAVLQTLYHHSDADLKAPEFADDYRRTLIHFTNLFKKTGLLWKRFRSLILNASQRDINQIFIHARDPNDFEELRKIAEEEGIKIYAVWIAREGIEPANEQDAIGEYYPYDLIIILPNIDLEPERYAGVVREFISYKGE